MPAGSISIYVASLSMTRQASRRAEALELADQLLNDIEMSSIGPMDIARKTSRLARLLDDAEAMKWLSFEVGGYPSPLTVEATQAARRSNRVMTPEEDDDSEEMLATGTLGQIEALVDGAKARITVASGSSAERTQVQGVVVRLQPVIDKVVGSMHAYVVEQYQELRFGSAVESAFEVVRRDVDSSIGALVPSALPMLSAAFENATSSNPEDWASAAGTCRRLLKAVADAVRPPGEPVEGRAMGDSNYINRLVDWIFQNSNSATAAKVVTADLAYLGKRLDAADSAGHKGAHAMVSRFEASRFITGTYLMLGDVLRIADSVSTTV
jgi:hypothetical protein